MPLGRRRLQYVLSEMEYLLSEMEFVEALGRGTWSCGTAIFLGR